MEPRKYRAWDKKEKVMGRVPVINFDLGVFIEGNSPKPQKIIKSKDGKSLIVKAESTEGHFVKFKDCVVMQFTGLLDKNGKEIYEGDVTNNGEVFWDVDQLSYRLRDLEPHPRYGREEHDFFAFTTPFEVIGNIYENPELI